MWLEGNAPPTVGDGAGVGHALAEPPMGAGGNAVISTRTHPPRWAHPAA